MSSEQEIEQEIQDRGLTAPRLTPESVSDVIRGKDFYVFEDSCLTVCCLTLQNGFTVTGESACASPENFNAEIGEKIAFENARNKVWALEGYLLKQRLFEEPKTFSARLEEEFLELSGKVSKINTFIESDSFEDISKIQQELLVEQSTHMMEYVDVLCKRISNIEE